LILKTLRRSDPHDGSSALKIADDELEDLVENQSIRSGDLATAARSIPPSGETDQSPVLGSRATTTEPPSTVLANAICIPLKSRIEVTSSIGDVSSFDLVTIYF
tara:strand:+ start:141 stop:452 length:312 start_codon:yes stop_codon:yes gene_type:complete